MDPKWRSDVSSGQVGSVRVERFEVSPAMAEIDAMRAAFHGGRQLAVPPGIYTRLVEGSGPTATLWMSDTPSERLDHVEAIRRAQGRVLVTGLGLGLVVQEMLAKAEVTQVCVQERSPEIIALVAPALTATWGTERLAITCVDALAYKPAKGERYDVIWHDVWESICADNLATMRVLKRKWARRCNWQGCWRERSCRQQERQFQRFERQDAVLRTMARTMFSGVS